MYLGSGGGLNPGTSEFQSSRWVTPLSFPIKVVWSLNYGGFHEKFNFLKIQDLRPLNTCQKHFEMILVEHT